MLDDIELIKKVLDGQTGCYSFIMNKYEQGIMRFIYKIVKNKETAEDLSQEVFITAYYKLHTFKHQYRLSTWLYTIANNKCIDFLRKNKKLQEVNSDNVLEAAGGLTPESEIEYKETKELVTSYLKTLNEMDRKILALRSSEENLTFYEIAQILDMSKSNVKKRYYNIIDKYEKLKNQCENSFSKGVI